MKYQIVNENVESELNPLVGTKYGALVQKEISQLDWRVKDDPSKIPMYSGGGTEEANRWWYGHGWNHRLIDGKFIARDLPGEGYEIWTLDVETQEKLHELLSSYPINTEFTITPANHSEDLPELRIRLSQ